MTHSLERTSPKGEDFVGRCVLCGKQGLPMTAALEKCPNPRNVTNEEAIINAIKGPNGGQQGGLDEPVR